MDKIYVKEDLRFDLGFRQRLEYHCVNLQFVVLKCLNKTLFQIPFQAYSFIKSTARR